MIVCTLSSRKPATFLFESCCKAKNWTRIWPLNAAMAEYYHGRRKKSMVLMRTMLLAASQNAWLREHAVHYPFVRRSVSRFMPGEDLDAALAAANQLRQKNIGSVFTHLGENVADRNEAMAVTSHYLEVL